jgi:ribose-phosphate pyrophosphokinase
MIICDGVEFMKFPAGETFFKYTGPKENDRIEIEWQYEDDSEIFQIANLLHYFNNKIDFKIIDLYASYFPHARQDRFTNDQQPFSLEVVFNILYPYRDGLIIYVCDIHSDVYKKYHQLDIINHLPDNSSLPSDLEYDFIICPDKGARKRTEYFRSGSNKRIIYCEKTRDPSTGKLGKPEITLHDRKALNGAKVLIVDDICDGGGTFQLLAQELKLCGTEKIYLYVTHGIFSKGLEAMPDIDKIFTTKSMYHKYKNMIGDKLCSLG